MPQESTATASTSQLHSATIANPKAGQLGISLSNSKGIGVLVTGADEADLAAQAGIRPGNVIHAVNGKVVHTHDVCLKLMQASGPVEISYYSSAAEIPSSPQRIFPRRLITVAIGFLAVAVIGGVVLGVTLSDSTSDGQASWQALTGSFSQPFCPADTTTVQSIPDETQPTYSYSNCSEYYNGGGGDVGDWCRGGSYFLFASGAGVNTALTGGGVRIW